MPLTIQVEGINVYGTHGVYDQEKMNGQNFRIDLLIELKENILNFENYKSESFENTINYENLVNEVINVSDSNSFDLIETFAYEILNRASSHSLKILFFLENVIFNVLKLLKKCPPVGSFLFKNSP